mgnify:CR=1 FL=1
MNLLNEVILSESEGAEPSTPPDKLEVFTNEPPVIPEAYSIEEFAVVPHADTAAPAVV